MPWLALSPGDPWGVCPREFSLSWGCLTPPAAGCSSPEASSPPPLQPSPARRPLAAGAQKKPVPAVPPTSPQTPLSLCQVCPGSAPRVTSDTWALGRSRASSQPLVAMLWGGGSQSLASSALSHRGPRTQHLLSFARGGTWGLPHPRTFPCRPVRNASPTNTEALVFLQPPSPRLPGAPGKVPDGTGSKRASSEDQSPCTQ